MKNEELEQLVLEALGDLKAKEIRTIDVKNKTSVTDIIVIASGNSTRQVKALADNVVVRVKERGVEPLGIEGGQGSGWVLVDLGDIVVHVMLPETRDFYNLEKLWGEDAPVDAAVLPLLSEEQ